MIKGKAGFISKLEAILQNHSHQEIITWSNAGNSFLILNPEHFEQYILTSYFRHKRISSFVRQLNMYGFRKCRGGKEILEFKHPLFSKNLPQQHHLIERKKSTEVSFDIPNLFKKISIESMKELDIMQDTPEQIQAEPSDQSIPQLRTKFRLNSSQMTIRLNQRLTSLCNVDDNFGEMQKSESMGAMSQQGQIEVQGEDKFPEGETLLLTESPRVYKSYK